MTENELIEQITQLIESKSWMIYREQKAERIAELCKAHYSQEWISINDRLPDYGIKVLATYKNRCGKSRRVCASYVPRYTEESSPYLSDEYTYDEYREEDDTYYIRKGWYEQIDNWGELTSVHICEGDVTHWSPLPE